MRWGLQEPFLDTTRYQLISEEEAKKAANKLYKTIYQWTWKYSICESLNLDRRTYIRKQILKATLDPFGYLYLTIKIHKTPISTRPICSNLASLPHSLGQWVDLVLQPLVTSQPTYFKDSFTLKRKLNTLVIPAYARIFTYDAVSMYANINLDDCLECISTFLSTIWDKYECTAITSAMEIVMKNNGMRFGDLIFHQICGVAMGMSPTPTIANLYVAIYEATHILPLLNSFLFFLKRFIDDGLGIWLHDPDPDIYAANWTLFKTLINAMGLKWMTTELSKKVIFMDMTIEIIGNELITSLYSKPMALYQYISPMSCHQPGALSGLIFGHTLWIFQLCSRDQDVDSELATFYHHLLDHGYETSNIIPLLIKGIDNANHFLSLTKAQWEEAKKAQTGRTDKRVFFHLPFHPQNPSLGVTQRLWWDLLLSPPGKEILNLLYNRSGYPVPVKRLTVAYHRNPNLANILSYRNLTKLQGWKPHHSSLVQLEMSMPSFFQSFAKRDGKCLKKWGIWKYYLNLLSQWPFLYLWDFLWEFYLGSDSSTFQSVRTSLYIFLTTPIQMATKPSDGHKFPMTNTWNCATLLCWDLPYFLLP